MTTAPAYVRNGRLDVLGANQLGRAVCSPLFATPGRPVNIARFIFLDPAAPEFYLEWDSLAGDSGKTRALLDGLHLAGEIAHIGEKAPVQTTQRWDTRPQRRP